MWKDFKEIWCGMRTAALQTFVRIQNDVYGKSTSKKDSFDHHASSWQLMNIIFLEQNSALKLLLYSKKITSSVLSSHTSLEVPVGQKKRTFDTTYLGSLWIYWRLIFYLSANKTSSLFRDSCQDTQPIQPIFGRLFCLCTTGPQKRLDVLFAHG